MDGVEVAALVGRICGEGVIAGTVGVLGGVVGLPVGLPVGEFAGALVGDGGGVSEMVAVAGDVAGRVAGGRGVGDAGSVGLPNMTKATATSAEKSANNSDPRA
jgi:hypothetical protein